jgi:TatD DNase family protein
MSGLVDTHAHLMDAAFDVDREAVVARARAAGVAAFVFVGYDRQSSVSAVELARRVDGARASVGIHPNSAGDASDADFEVIAELALLPEVVGIGETGLDYYRRYTPYERQREVFDWHLDLAARLNLPVIVHNRQADSDITERVRAHSATGVLHCFSSTDPSYLERMLALGYVVSFAGPLTFKNATATREMASRVPMDRLLVETDCPYLAPEPHRGRRNEPAFVRDTAICLTEVTGVTIDTLWANSLRVFPALARVAAGEAVA